MILRAALKVLEKWKATPEQSCRILRVSRSCTSRIQRGKFVERDCDQLERASIVLNRYTSLRLLFDDPEDANGFVAMENHNDFFNGRKPLQIMAPVVHCLQG